MTRRGGRRARGRRGRGHGLDEDAQDSHDGTRFEAHAPAQALAVPLPAHLQPLPGTHDAPPWATTPPLALSAGGVVVAPHVYGLHPQAGFLAAPAVLGELAPPPPPPPPGARAAAHAPRPPPRAHGVEQRVLEVTRQIDQSCAATGDHARAWRLVEDLLRSGLRPSLVTANVLIKCHRRARQPEGAERVLGVMGGWGLAPDAYSYNQVLAAYVDAHRAADAHRVFHAACELGLDDGCTHATVLRACTPASLPPVLSAMRLRGRADAVPLHAALKVLSDAGLADDCEAFVRANFAGSGIAVAGAPPPSARTFTLLARAHAVARAPEAAERTLWRALGGQPRGVAAGARGGAADASPDAAVDASPDAAGAPAVAPDAVLFAVVVDTYASVQPHARVSDAVRVADEAVARLRAARAPPPSTSLFNALLKAHARARAPSAEGVARAMALARESGARLDVVSVSTAADALCVAGRPEEAHALVEACRAADGIAPNGTVYNTLIKGYARCRCVRNTGACACDPCRCSSPEAALRLVRQMHAEGLAPDTVTLNTLVAAFCRANRLAEAREVVSGMALLAGSADGCAADGATYSLLLRAMLRGAARTGRARPGEEERAADGALDAAAHAAPGGGVSPPGSEAGAAAAPSDSTALLDGLRAEMATAGVRPDAPLRALLAQAYLATRPSATALGRAAALLEEELAQHAGGQRPGAGGGGAGGDAAAGQLGGAGAEPPAARATRADADERARHSHAPASARASAPASAFEAGALSCEGCGTAHGRRGGAGAQQQAPVAAMCTALLHAAACRAHGGGEDALEQLGRARDTAARALACGAASADDEALGGALCSAAALASARGCARAPTGGALPITSAPAAAERAAASTAGTGARAACAAADRGGAIGLSDAAAESTVLPAVAEGCCQPGPKECCC